jgi:opacity protein-like surface antigen
MRIALRLAVATIALASLSAAASAQEDARDAAPSPWRLNGIVGGMNSVQGGLGVQRDLGPATGVFSSRLEGQVLARIVRPSPLTFAMPGDFDDRSVLASAALGWSAELGPRRASGERSVYLLVGAGVTAVRWDDGTRWERGVQVDAPRNTTETAATWSGGVGFRPERGGGRFGVELRVDRALTRFEALDGARLAISLRL